MSSIEFKPRLSKREKQINEKKWVKELSVVNRVFDNRWMYRIFRDWGTPTNKGFVPLHSNINLKECLLINSIIRTLKPTRTVEIGCAMGVSGMVIVNALATQCKSPSFLISVDPFQDTQWGMIGVKNIKKAMKYSSQKCDVTHKWVKEKSASFWSNTQANTFDQFLLMVTIHLMVV